MADARPAPTTFIYSCFKGRGGTLPLRLFYCNCSTWWHNLNICIYILLIHYHTYIHLLLKYHWNFLLFYYRQNCQQFYLWEGDFGGEPCSVVSLSSSSEKFPVISPYLNYFYSGWLNPQIEIEKKDILFHPENYRPYSKLSDLASELVWTNLNLSGLRELIHSSPSI